MKFMNEYLYLYRKIMNTHLKDYEEIRWRRELTKKYSWAVPNEEAIRIITKYSPIIEIGAGTGFWAMLLIKRGVDIISFDLYPFKKNLYHNITQWFPIKKGTYMVLKNHPKRNLFLCWPPYNNNIALECLKWFKGKFLIYIGEDIRGCNATDGFFKKLERDFILIQKIKIPQWWRVHDNLTIWEKNNR